MKNSNQLHTELLKLKEVLKGLFTKTPDEEVTVKFRIPASSQEIASPAEEEENAVSGKPDIYPCIVLRLMYGVYYYFPVFINNYGDHGYKYCRHIHINRKHPNANEIELNMLGNLLAEEAVKFNCEACLCLTPDSGYYYFPDEHKVYKTEDIPSNSDWLSDEEFLNGYVKKVE